MYKVYETCGNFNNIVFEGEEWECQDHVLEKALDQVEDIEEETEFEKELELFLSYYSIEKAEDDFIINRPY